MFGDPSPEVRATPRGRPPRPTGLQATAGDGQVTLSWDAMTKLTGWRYQYYKAGAAPTGWAAVSGGGGATSVTVTGLTNDTGYTLSRIHRMDTDGRREDSGRGVRELQAR